MEWCSWCMFEDHDGAEEPCINCVTSFDGPATEFFPKKPMNDPNKYGTWQEGIFDEYKPIDKLMERREKYADKAHFTVVENPKTNADRIRSMSDEELAMFLQDIFYISGNNDTSHGWWLDWLKQEASDGTS